MGIPLGSCACAVWRGRKACRRCDASDARLLAARVRSPIFVRCLSRRRPPPAGSLPPGVLRGVPAAHSCVACLPACECVTFHYFSRSSDSALTSLQQIIHPVLSIVFTLLLSRLGTEAFTACSSRGRSRCTAAPQILASRAAPSQVAQGGSGRTPCLRSARRHAAAHAGLQRAS